MLISLNRTLVLIAALGIAWMAPAGADRHQNVDGLQVYLGIAPSQHLIEHPSVIPAGHPVAAGDYSYHVLVALFDASSGARVNDATVIARVAPLGMGGPDKAMLATVIGGQLTYCNFFDLVPRTSYTIDLRIQRPDGQKISTVSFVQRPMTGFTR